MKHFVALRQETDRTLAQLAYLSSKVMQVAQLAYLSSKVMQVVQLVYRSSKAIQVVQVVYRSSRAMQVVQLAYRSLASVARKELNSFLSLATAIVEERFVCRLLVTGIMEEHFFYQFPAGQTKRYFPSLQIEKSSLVVEIDVILVNSSFQEFPFATPLTRVRFKIIAV